ncbi:TMV resistance protein N [Artemisia annua]|uniref:TMV resistance protein N n=1 Tax=Artemisia annua TaxID=35608 RepID=A0A2U1LAJ0_ARTAN|nr:TMV resistance protein N [Artemisia annua]
MADPSSNFYTYDVFLSFRGEDTRKNFVDHLYSALVQNGIKTFKDDHTDIPNDVLQVIEESSISVIVFSKDYASSAWCLDELVKIMECNKRNGQFVLPVYYYDFSPSNLRKHGPVFGELFGKSEMGKVKEWTSALVEASNLSGFGLTDPRYQEMRIKEIVEMVLGKLEKAKPTHHSTGIEHDKLGDTSSTLSQEKLIGIERRVQQVKELLEVETEKTANFALSSSSPQPFSWTYDVFLCFKNNDTCKDFADQLEDALEEQGIYVFSSDKGLAKDESVASEHLKAIEESCISAVILSRNFASDSYCLNELVKIMNCNEEIGQLVLTIFYDVDPSDIRNQKGGFVEALMQNKSEEVELWSEALVKASSLAGWYLNGTPKSHEGTCIKSIVDMISRRLDCLPSSVDDNLIGIEVHMKEVMKLLKLESGGVHMLGIWGMGGIGKTTIARAVYDEVSTYFEVSCFIENIREVSKFYGLEHVQKEVISRVLFDDSHLRVGSVDEGTNLIRDHLSRRIILMVLDDVDHKSQLEALAGAYDWFGEGSRIMITTRDESVLVAHNIMHNYKVIALGYEESSQFLRMHAFKKDDLTKGYEDLLPRVIDYAAGLPLALKVISFLLFGKSKKEWTDILARLKVYPEKEIQDTLKISFDGLDDDTKDVFLDVACFFNGMQKHKVVRILGDNGIRLLEQKSLLCIESNGCIYMHHLLEQVGRDIVRQMHPDAPMKRSRLWLADEISDILMDKTGTEKISAIVVDKMHNQDAIDMTNAFRNMRKLRFLHISRNFKLRFLQETTYLPNNLRWLTWENYPLKSLPTNFKANKLISLELVHSDISELQFGDKYMGTLRYLNLSFCTKLIKTPDFTKTPNLEELELEYCTSLKTLPRSIGSLKRLTMLNLGHCEKLANLPRSLLQLSLLRHLNVAGCSNLRLPRLVIDVSPAFPTFRNLVEIDLSAYRASSLRNLHSLDHPKGFPLRIVHVNMIRDIPFRKNLNVSYNILGPVSDHSSVSESQASQESID